ncbi:TPA: hypothetical protein PB378_002832 [Staphylococcus aureus]|nr:hypothetical protein [Staphylococcus aureus]HDE0301130.1 hypothetical protein [Staphylococcus aureus]HDE0835928.1 hypothetical protein [Staphylococcus aureus]HDE0838764.1 hypothetical protein [Staphylococcus aureus]HDE0844369.1 hypothetical protein [Staphylococcus aureus]
MNLSDEDKLYISRMTDQIKRSNTHEIKVSIETDDKLSEFIKQKIDEKFDEKIPNLRTKQTMEQFKWSLMRIEDKQEILDDNIESVHKWATYFKSALMLTLFAVLLISVVATFMGGLFNVLGFDYMYKGLEYQIKHSEGFVAFLWHLGYLIPYLLLATLIWLILALEHKYRY